MSCHDTVVESTQPQRCRVHVDSGEYLGICTPPRELIGRYQYIVPSAQDECGGYGIGSVDYIVVYCGEYTVV